jgi:predicted Zn-dependent peptidase
LKEIEKERMKQMQNSRIEEVFSKEGLSIYKIPFEKFKTNTITLTIHDDLTKDSVAKNALIPAILKQGTKEYPTRRELSIALKNLYGAVFDGGVSKKGERHIIHFYIETIKDMYGDKAENLSEKALELLFQMITNPVLENGAFLTETVETEKNNMKKYIEGKLNDKVSYSLERCIEEMCEEEAYGLSESGTIEDYEEITPENLYQHYQDLLQKNPISIYVTGEVKDELIEKIKEKFLVLDRSDVKKIKDTTFKDAPLEVKETFEELNINQGKLCMGYRTNIHPSTFDYYKLVVYNSILGGGIHSKLFQNVREKEGLAYYAYSKLDRFKGLMVISSGIEVSNKEKVVSIVNQQLDELAAGNISDYEFHSAKKQIISGLNSIKDSQLSLTDFYMSGSIIGENQTLEDFIENINKVKQEDVVEISKVIKPDTIYFLHGKGV